VNFRTIWICIVLAIYGSANMVTQQFGRAGRDIKAVPEAEAILYHTEGDMKVAQDIVDAGPPKSKTDKAPKMDYAMARLLLADCKCDEQNQLYNNPKEDTPCSCRGCTASHAALMTTRTAPCRCSGCTLDDIPDLPTKPEPLPQTKGFLVMADIKLVTERFERLRRHLANHADEANAHGVDPHDFLPDNIIKRIANDWLLVQDRTVLQSTLEGAGPLVVSNLDKIHGVIHELLPILADSKEKRKRKPKLDDGVQSRLAYHVMSHSAIS
jgi:hypothetical protein